MQIQDCENGTSGLGPRSTSGQSQVQTNIGLHRAYMHKQHMLTVGLRYAGTLLYLGAIAKEGGWPNIQQRLSSWVTLHASMSLETTVCGDHHHVAPNFNARL